jgi:hypothetical protein
MVGFVDVDAKLVADIAWNLALKMSNDFITFLCGGDFTFRDEFVILVSGVLALIVGVHGNLLDFCDENFQGIITCSPFLYLPNFPIFNTSR